MLLAALASAAAIVLTAVAASASVPHGTSITAPASLHWFTIYQYAGIDTTLQNLHRGELIEHDGRVYHVYDAVRWGNVTVLVSPRVPPGLYFAVG